MADMMRWNRLMYFCMELAPAFSPIYYKFEPKEEPNTKQFHLQEWTFHFDPEFEDGELALGIIHMATHFYAKHVGRGRDRDISAWHDSTCCEVYDMWDKHKDQDHLQKKIPNLKWMNGSDLREFYGLKDNEIAEGYYDKILNKRDEMGASTPGGGFQKPTPDQESASGNPCRFDASNLPNEDKEVSEVMNEVDELLQSQQAGKMPGAFKREISPEHERPIPWQSKLKRKLSSLPGYQDYALLPRPRYYHHIPRGGIMKRLQKGLPRMLVVIDDSGSMDPELLNECFGICRSMMRQGAKPNIAAGDTRLTFYGTLQQALHAGITGGGGTDMGKVVWEAYNSSREKPEATVLLTDGETPWPDKMPPNTVICILNRYHQPNVPDYLANQTIYATPRTKGEMGY